MRRTAKRRNRRKNPSELTINLTPLIDTALTLLVIFMITAPMLQHGIKIELPQGKAQEVTSAQQDMVVYIDKKEKWYLNDEPATLDESLIDLIKKKLGNDVDRPVFVKADCSVNYGKVIEMVDRMKYVGGVKHVVLATQKRS